MNDFRKVFLSSEQEPFISCHPHSGGEASEKDDDRDESKEEGEVDDAEGSDEDDNRSCADDGDANAIAWHVPVRSIQYL